MGDSDANPWHPPQKGCDMITVAMARKFRLLAFFLLAVGCTKSASEPISSAPAQIQEVSVARAHALVDGDTVTVLDVRTPAEYAQGHIEGAVNIDFRAKDFAAEIGKLDRSHSYLLHCRSGGRSARALKVMQDQGFTAIYHMADGYIAWEATAQQTP